MEERVRVIAGAALLALGTTAPVDSATAPAMALGQCVSARVAVISSRLEGEPESGTNITLTNGITSISYDVNRQAQAAKIGDEVIACLISKPEGCPKGDDRGKVYTVVNLRTRGSWTMPNDEHSCGGA